MKKSTATGRGGARNGRTLPAIRIEANAGDGEPRVRDTDLMARLGYTHIDAFRKVIRKHAKFLNKINVLSSLDVNPDPAVGGRPGKVYLLTEAQAVFIIGKAGTPDADAIFAEIAIAFVEYRRASFRTDLYGALARDLFLPAPRGWEKEFPERFWAELHRVGGWTRPTGNNHSNCGHFINGFVYRYLLGSLGLLAIREANPRGDGGERTHRHHQLLKDRHIARLRQHINTVTVLLANSVSLKHFADQFARSFPDSHAQLGFLFRESGSDSGD